MDEYPGNSNGGKSQHAKPPRVEDGSDKKEVLKPIAGLDKTKVTRKKRSFVKRLRESLFGGAGSTEGVASYVFFDVMLPAARDMIVDTGTEAIHRAVYGEARPGYSRRSRPGRGLGSSGLGHVAYDSISNRAASTREERTQMSRRARANFRFDEVILPSRVLADEVLDRLMLLLEKFQMVTVADLYELIEEDINHNDDKFGWVDLQGSYVSRLGAGYILNLPQPIPLD